MECELIEPAQTFIAFEVILVSAPDQLYISFKKMYS